jgi:uncharacterized membrane protein
MEGAVLEISWADRVAIAWFLAAWIGYGLAIEQSRLGRRSLNARMDSFRKVWMRRMLERELRIVDTTIMATLQNGTAFFASTALIALGGALSFLRAPEETLRLVGDLPYAAPMSRALWEVKIIGLAIILAYAFFKFAWSYRLMNYAAILLGATPNVFDAADAEALRMADRVAAMNTIAGAHFNRGQRAFFFALGYMGWFMGPLILLVTTAAVLAVMAVRQFQSDALHALEEKG